MPKKKRNFKLILWLLSLFSIVALGIFLNSTAFESDYVDYAFGYLMFLFLLLEVSNSFQIVKSIKLKNNDDRKRLMFFAFIGGLITIYLISVSNDDVTRTAGIFYFIIFIMTFQLIRTFPLVGDVFGK